MRQIISNDDLLKLYDTVFDASVDAPTSKAGKAHLKALKAIYQRGADDHAEWVNRKNT